MKIFKASVLIAFFLEAGSIFSPASGDLVHWEFSGWYGGGCYPNVEFDPNIRDRIYLVSDVAGIWRSNDSGENWHFMNQGLQNLNVSLISVAPSDSDVVYAGTSKGLFVWREADQAWRACDTHSGEIAFVRPANHRSIAISRSDPDVITVGTASGAVFHSEDAGRTWRILGNLKSPFNERRPITAMAYGDSGKVLYAACAKGMAVYSFRSRLWSLLERAPRPIQDFVLARESPDKIYAAGQTSLYITMDGGKSWKQSAPVPNGATYRVSAINTQEGTFVAAAWKKDWTAGIVLSRDDGATWIKGSQNLIPDLSNPTRAWAAPGVPITALKIDPFNVGVMFYSDYWGVWRSSDGGASWQEKIQGAPNVIGSDIVIGGAGNIYAAAMDNGLVASSDQGRSYRPLCPVEGYRKDLNGHIWRVMVLGEEDGTIVATSSPWGEDINQVVLSTDGGVNFRTVRQGLPARRPKINTLWGRGYPRALAADPQNHQNLYLGIDGDDGGGLYVSRDGGGSWALSHGQPASRRIYNALAVDPSNPAIIYWGACGEEGGIYLSRDRGTTWRHVFSTMRWVFDLKIAPDGTVYASGDDNGPCLYSSSDQGASWRLVKRFPSNGVAEAIVIDPKNGGRVALSSVQWGGASGGRIYWTADGGKSWHEITGDLPPCPGAAAMAFAPDSSHLYISLYAGSIYKTDLNAFPELNHF